MASFRKIHELKDLINKPTGYKKPNNPTGNDLIMTNRPKSKSNLGTFETGLWHFH